MSSEERQIMIEQMTKNLYDNNRCNKMGYLQTCKTIDLENMANIARTKKDMNRGKNRTERIARQKNTRFHKLQSEIYTAIKGQ